LSSIYTLSLHDALPICFFDRAKKDLADLRAYPLEKQDASQKLSTHILEWYLTQQIEGEKFQWHNYPVNQLFGVQSEFPSFMANTDRKSTRLNSSHSQIS